jgi:uncharacterized protein (DUF2267 family)
MNRGELVHEVQRRGDFDSAEAAEAAVLATLSVLGERLKGGEAKDLAAQLPRELADAVETRGPGERFDLTEFYRRVAEREERDVNPALARDHARIVLEVVLDAVSPGERDDVLHQLPEGWRNDIFGNDRPWQQR